MHRATTNQPAHTISLDRTQPFLYNITVKMSSSAATVTRASLDHKLALAKRCSREATFAGAKAAAVATVASAVPTLASVRMLPWAKANLNPTGQALIVCTVAGMAYFVAADKTILSLARRHSYESAPDHLKDTSFGGAAAAPARPRPRSFFRP
uniref:Early nodulin n=2 Tax=Hordeum vulgare subsp. vulgare TaxID=112509 RepID=A0A287VM92_HORVV